MKALDPARMLAAERLAELGELLAAGAQRLLARQIKPAVPQHEPADGQEQLDAVAAVEAQCRASIEVPA
jgi:hypothetical protein